MSKASNEVIKILPFAKAEDLLHYLRRANHELKDSSGFYCNWVFRGQADASWDLVPSAFRTTKSIQSNLIDRYLNLINKDRPKTEIEWREIVLPQSFKEYAHLNNGLVAEAAKLALAHLTLIREFVLLALNSGHPLENAGLLWHLYNFKLTHKIEGHEKNVLEYYFHGGDISMSFAVAQHHGIPTGLLDWTDNPLVAAYFAVQNLVEDVHKDNSMIKGMLSIWALNREYLNRNFEYIKRFTIPPKVTPFVDAQEGLFIWMPKAYLFYAEKGKFPTIEEMITESVNQWTELEKKLPQPVLMKFTLPKSEAGNLIKMLWRERVTAAHLMPSFDNISSSMVTKSFFL